LEQGDILEVVDDVLQKLRNGVEKHFRTVISMQPDSRDKIEKILTFHDGFEIHTEARNFGIPHAEDVGVLGELSFLSGGDGSYKENSEAYKRILTEFPASGMQTWVMPLKEPRGCISTGLKKVVPIFNFSDRLSEEALLLQYFHFVNATDSYQKFVHSILKLKG
jgi:hypothetical protein